MSDFLLASLTEALAVDSTTTLTCVDNVVGASHSYNTFITKLDNAACLNFTGFDCVTLLASETPFALVLEIGQNTFSKTQRIQSWKDADGQQIIKPESKFGLWVTCNVKFYIESTDKVDMHGVKLGPLVLGKLATMTHQVKLQSTIVQYTPKGISVTDDSTQSACAISPHTQLFDFSEGMCRHCFRSLKKLKQKTTSFLAHQGTTSDGVYKITLHNVVDTLFQIESTEKFTFSIGGEDVYTINGYHYTHKNKYVFTLPNGIPICRLSHMHVTIETTNPHQMFTVTGECYPAFQKTLLVDAPFCYNLLGSKLFISSNGILAKSTLRANFEPQRYFKDYVTFVDSQPHTQVSNLFGKHTPMDLCVTQTECYKVDASCTQTKFMLPPRPYVQKIMSNVPFVVRIVQVSVSSAIAYSYMYSEPLSSCDGYELLINFHRKSTDRVLVQIPDNLPDAHFQVTYLPCYRRRTQSSYFRVDVSKYFGTYSIGERSFFRLADFKNQHLWTPMHKTVTDKHYTHDIHVVTSMYSKTPFKIKGTGWTLASEKAAKGSKCTGIYQHQINYVLPFGMTCHNLQVESSSSVHIAGFNFPHYIAREFTSYTYAGRGEYEDCSIFVQIGSCTYLQFREGKIVVPDGKKLVYNDNEPDQFAMDEDENGNKIRPAIWNPPPSMNNHH